MPDVEKVMTIYHFREVNKDYNDSMLFISSLFEQLLFLLSSKNWREKKCNNDIASITFKFIVKSEYKLLKIISLSRKRRKKWEKKIVEVLIGLLRLHYLLFSLHSFPRGLVSSFWMAHTSKKGCLLPVAGFTLCLRPSVRFIW